MPGSSLGKPGHDESFRIGRDDIAKGVYSAGLAAEAAPPVEARAAAAFFSTMRTAMILREAAAYWIPRLRGE